jgi:GPH family glycoside/pentoside/hexuronide:cation symporter
MIGASFGTLLMSSLGFPIINYFGQNDESLGIIYLSCFAAFFAIIILYFTYASVNESSTNEVKETYPSISKLVLSILKNYPFWIVFSSILILGSTTIMFNKNLIYYIKYALDLHNYQGLVLGLSGLSSFASIPFWSYVSLKIGKRNTWQVSMSLLLLAFALFYYYQINSLQELIIIVCLIGIASGAGGVLFWSMLPDTIEYGEWKSGIRSESSLYGFMTFAQKSSIAVAALILGVLLTSINFTPNEVQTPETLSGLKDIMSLIPASGIAISIFLMYFYPINSEYHKELLINIEARKNG